MKDNKCGLLNRIGGVLHAVRQVINGRQLIDNENKFRIMCVVTALIHVAFLLNMIYMGIGALIGYNIFAVILYLILAFGMTKTGLFRPLMVIIYIEIEFHSAFTTFLIGWNWEFMLYTIALVPAAFYLANSLSNRTRHIGFSAVLSAFVIICYYVVSVVCMQFEPVCDTSMYTKIRLAMRIFNIFLAFFLQFVFAFLFALEVRYMERLLERENIKLGIEASLDPLTQLLNRRSMGRLMDEELAKDDDSPFCIAMLDLDDFKKINDTYGHDTGDIVLTTVADIIREEVREGDYCCRWGGEEFLLFIHGVMSDAKLAGERIRQRISEKSITSLDGREVRITLTLGLCEAQKGIQLRTLIETADQKLYYGKNHGKNQVVA